MWRVGRNESTPQIIQNASPLTSFPGEEDYPSLSPDGEQVAFAWNEKDGLNSDIYIKRIGSGPPLRLTDNPEMEVDPSWSPDGN
jgi:Tol biopolymer transport system component